MTSSAFAQEACSQVAGCSEVSPTAEQPALPDVTQVDAQAPENTGEAQTLTEQAAAPVPELAEEAPAATESNEPASAPKQTEAPTPSAGDGVPRVALISVIIGTVLIGAVAALAMSIVRFSKRTYEKYGYRVALNWINVLWPISATLFFIGAHAAEQADQGTSDIANLIAISLIVIITVQNIRKTSVVTGVIATIAQSLVLVFGVFLIFLYRLFNAPKRSETGT